MLAALNRRLALAERAERVALDVRRPEANGYALACARRYLTSTAIPLASPNAKSSSFAPRDMGVAFAGAAMAIKKSDLYSSIWASCDELRGGMDASQYKDFVLFMLFIKYVSDKYADAPFAPVTIPKGATFRDMIALKGKSDIGDRINTEIIGPLVRENDSLARTDFPDFNDPNKLGEGQSMVDRLSRLIAIFEKPELDFSKNRADNDDILGDAYEYLMRHFATESGKSKGQFYTPSEVSRVMAKVIGITPENASAKTTAYDPTCGSGSLLLKVAAEAGKAITLEGQEKDVTTAGLARMNMILHDFPGAKILAGNTLSDPKFKDEKDAQRLRQYDYVVANPPFSDKAWSTGITVSDDAYQRFAWGEPPAKQGDYAYLLHIIRSLKTTSGKGACILPHGVLFRGNAEGVIRTQLVRSGVLKAIIGLPANLFYGTGIPACILVLDKTNADARRAIFMVDASKGFIKDGNKNRLRERDIHRIVDVFHKLEAQPGFARLVPHDEIEKNDFNLNLPRYIDTQEAEDIQDIGGHLHGGIPTGDIDALDAYWKLCPALRATLFKPNRAGYADLLVPASELKTTIHEHPQFAAFIAGLKAHFAAWEAGAAKSLRALKVGSHPKDVIRVHAEELLAHASAGTANAEQPLIDAYAVYQHLMDYWSTTLQDDCYLIAADGWVAKAARVVETDKKGKAKDKGWTCDLVPKSLVVARYFNKEQAAIEQDQAALEAITASIAELEEEHGGEDGFLGGLDKIAKAEVSARLKEIKSDKAAKEERAVLEQWLKLSGDEADLKRKVREAEGDLDARAYAHYPKLKEADVQALVVDDKWLTTLGALMQSELDRVSQTLTSRIRLLADRYAAPLPQLVDEVAALAAKVDGHLRKMEGRA